MDIQERDLLRHVKRIEIKARGLSEQIFAGQYHSAFKGHGMTFSEVRGYQVGDDVRSIDWNVTARYATPYVKVFEEERELTLMLLIDLSGSTIFGSYQQKRELIAQVVATLAYSALNNKDRIGVIFFTDQIEKFIPPKSGRKHVLYIIRKLLGHQSKSKQTDISIALSYLHRVIKRRSTTFLISDFEQSPSSYQSALELVARKHDLIALRVSDPKEHELPNLGLLQIEDSESGDKMWIDSSDKHVRKTYADNYQHHRSETCQGLMRMGVDMTDLSTDGDLILALAKLFRRRG